MPDQPTPTSAPREGIDYYFNEQGLLVMTAAYHLSRGYCCGNGCQNCPYDFANVAPNVRQALRAKRAAKDDGSCYGEQS